MRYLGQLLAEDPQFKKVFSKLVDNRLRPAKQALRTAENLPAVFRAQGEVNALEYLIGVCAECEKRERKENG